MGRSLIELALQQSDFAYYSLCSNLCIYNDIIIYFFKLISQRLSAAQFVNYPNSTTTIPLTSTANCMNMMNMNRKLVFDVSTDVRDING